MPAPGPQHASDLTQLKAVKRQLIERHVRPDNLKGLAEVSLTLLPIAALAYASWRSKAMLPLAQLTRGLTTAYMKPPNGASQMLRALR